jgi:predicted amidohydrolase YtcJ
MSFQLKYFLFFLAGLIVVAVVMVEFNSQTADTIFVNGVVRTMDGANTVVEAFAVRGDRIVGLGTTAEIERTFKAKNRVDLKSKTVLPGFIDSHGHFFSLGIARMTVDLLGSGSEKEAAERVRPRIPKSQAGQWIRGRGWDQNEWQTRQFPTHASLDKVAPNNPVYLVRVDGHAIWVNDKVLQETGINRSTQDPPGGRIVRDYRGDPTGVFIDNAMLLIQNHLPPMSDSEAVEAMHIAAEECVKDGLTTVHDMGIDSMEVDLYKKLIEQDQLPLRIYAAVGGVGDLWNRFLKEGPLIGFGNNHLTIRSLKMYIDGALGSRGAALIEPYSDDPENRGLTVSSEELIRSATIEALKHGFQVCTHAIGDRGNDIVLRMYASALQEVPVKDSRLRIEHVQVLDPAEIPKFKEYGIVPSMQPTHATSDMYWAQARLGPTRVRHAYAWRSILNTGVIIPGGSDFPVENPNPIWGIYAAVTRKDREGKPRDAQDGNKYFQFSKEGMTDTTAFDNGWYPEQKMTREEALRSFTSWGAWAAFEEHLKGSLEKGMLADFVVLSSDIATVPDNEILNVRVLKTYVGGQEEFSANE